MVERLLPVFVTGITTKMLVVVPKLPLSFGRAQAQAVTVHLQDWDVTSNAKAMRFDTKTLK